MKYVYLPQNSNQYFVFRFRHLLWTNLRIFEEILKLKGLMKYTWEPPELRCVKTYIVPVSKNKVWTMNKEVKDDKNYRFNPITYHNTIPEFEPCLVFDVSKSLHIQTRRRILILWLVGRHSSMLWRYRSYLFQRYLGNIKVRIERIIKSTDFFYIKILKLKFW